MSILLTSAGSDSRGKSGWEGGEPLGDNTGREFQVVNYDPAFYNVPETCVLRCTNSAIANAIRIRHRQMADNNCFGYDQSQRMTAMAALRKTKNFDPSLCVIKCACDCSSSVGACVVLTLETQGIKTNISGSETTSVMRSVYLKSGWFTDVTKQVDLKTGAGLLPGDILLRQSKHVVIVWDVEKTPNKIPKWVGEVIKYCDVCEDEFKRSLLRSWDHLGIGNLVDVCDEKNGLYYVRIAGLYYGFVEKSNIKNVSSVQVRSGKATTDLYMRTQPVDGKKILTIPAGSTVTINDEVTAKNGAKWYNVTYHGANGYSSAKYIK